MNAGLLCLILAAAAPDVIADNFPAELPLSDLVSGDGSIGFVLRGVDLDDRAGWSVSAAGDVNGDGIDDLIIGAYNASPEGAMEAGECYVVFGRDTGFSEEFELASLASGNGSTGFVLYGVDAQDRAGFSVSAAGDINSDGIGDLIIGADRAEPGGRKVAGESYVVFGRDTGFPAEFELSSLASGDGSAGFVVNGLSFNYSGASLSGAGDINGDGIDDLIIGARGSLDIVGVSYVVFGRDTDFPAELDVLSLRDGDGSDGFTITGIDTGDFAGRSVSAAGDINGDNIDDLIIGAIRGDPGGVTDAGETYVVFGRDTGFPAVLALSSLPSGDGSTGFVINGHNNTDYSGLSVSGAGDINDDGLDDLIIGAYLADPQGRESAGRSYVVFGRDTGFPAEFELSSLFSGNGASGFIINGINPADVSGFSVSGAGDLNGDNVDDIVIGAFGTDPQDIELAGSAYVLYGRSITPFGAQFDLSTLLTGEGDEGFVIQGIDHYGLLGTSVSAAGDVNNDGMDDLIIGGPGTGSTNPQLTGNSYVVFGRPSDIDDDGTIDLLDNCVEQANGDQRDTNGDGFGNVCDPDLNNDGIVNFQDVQLWLPFFNQVNTGDADFDGNGNVNFVDFQLILEFFLRPPGPSNVVTE